MVTRSSIPAAFALAVLACGCTTVPLAEDARRSIRSVSVSAAVEQPETLSYFGPELEGYEPFPPGFLHVPLFRELTLLWSVTPIGLWQTWRAYGRMERALTDRIRGAGIDVGELLRARFLGKLRDAAVFPAVVDAGGDAEFVLAVECGLSTAGGGMEPGVRPWLVVDGRLRDAAGTVLWRKRAKVSTFRDAVPAYEIERIYVQPELFRDAVNRAAGIAAAELIAHLRGRE
jgi:hypothetical protein